MFDNGLSLGNSGVGKSIDIVAKKLLGKGISGIVIEQPEVVTLPMDDKHIPICKEYILIKEKKSKQSRNVRDAIVIHVEQNLLKLGHINKEQIELLK